MVENFIKALIVGIGASIPLGPIGILCIQKTLSKGKISGLFTGFGSSFADTFYSALALLSLAFINEWLVDNKLWVMIIGGIIILFVGLRIAVKNPVKQMQQPKQGNGKYFQETLQGLAITIANPGAMVLLLGLFAFVGIDISTPTKSMIFVILAGVFCGTALWWYILCTVVNIFRKKFRIHTLLLINRISGIIIAALGLMSAVQGIFRYIIESR